MESNRLILNRVRNFGEIISDGFRFVRKTYKVQFELFLIWVAPVLIISLYFLYFLFNDLTIFQTGGEENIKTADAGRLLISYAGILLSVLIFYFIVYATATVYVKEGNSIPDRAAVAIFMREKLGRFGLYILAILLLGLLLMLVASSVLMVSRLLVLPLLAGMIFTIFYMYPLMILLPMQLLNANEDLPGAIKETWNLISGNWGSTFGVLVITNIIGSMVSYIFVLPLQIIIWFRMFSSPEGFSPDDGVGTLNAIVLIVSFLSGIVVMTYTISAASLKYYDLRARKSNESLKAKIEKIGEERDNFFENEGDF